MRPLTQWLRPVLALLVIAHGLAHAMLTPRGWMEPAMLERDAMPLILYTVATVGFTVAGIGLLGVTPFTSAVRPLLALASAYSLVAIWHLGAGTMWWSAPFDVVLFLIGVTGLYRRLPARPQHGMWVHRAGVAVASVFILSVAAAMILSPFYRAW